MEIQTAVRLIHPSELSKHAISEGTSVVKVWAHHSILYSLYLCHRIVLQCMCQVDWIIWVFCIILLYTAILSILLQTLWFRVIQLVR